MILLPVAKGARWRTIQTALKIRETAIVPSIGELKAHAATTDKNFEMLTERMAFQFKALMSEMHAMRAQIETSNHAVVLRT